MDDDAIQLLKQGNKQTLEQMEKALSPSDPCTPKHEALVLPFAKRTFELMEMQFNQGDKKQKVIPVPTPWGVLPIEPRDFIRVVAMALIGWMVWMSNTDKEERKELLRDVRAWKQTHSAEHADKVTKNP